MNLLEIKQAAQFLEDNVDLFSPKKGYGNKDGGIVGIKNTLAFIIDKNNKVIMQRQILSNELKKQIEKIEYNKNIFLQQCKDVRWSPFEADRDRNCKYIVGGVKKGIDFPKFASIPMVTLLLFGQIPDFIEFCKIWLIAFTEVVPENEIGNIKYDDYLIGFSGQWKNVGKILTYTDGHTLTNKVIRFKKRYWENGYVTNFLFNEFTTEIFCCRAFKIYGSIIRDSYHTTRLHFLSKLDTEYSLQKDYKGSDGEIGSYGFRSYVDSNHGNEFGKKKEEERHHTLKANLFELKMDLEGVSNLKTLSDKKLLEIANQIKKQYAGRITIRY